MTTLSTLNKRDKEWIARRIPKAVREFLKTRHHDVFLAGGFLRSCIAHEEVHDVDLFAATVDIAELTAMKLADGSPVIRTDNAFTLELDGVTVQVIHRWTFATPSECVASFDFTIAQAAMWWHPEANQWETCCHPDYYEDLAAKRLIYTSPVRNEDAGGSLLRLIKFVQRGYRAPLDSLAAVVSRLMSGIRAEQRSLPEGERTAILSGLLLEVDPSIAMREALNQG